MRIYLKVYIFSFSVIFFGLIVCGYLLSNANASAIKLFKISTINEIPEFLRETVYIYDGNEVLRKIKKIVADGHSKLQIVTDFDQTLTRHTMDNGTRVLTSFGMFQECPSTPQYYKDEVKRLSDIYKPIEADPLISVEEKRRRMMEWYIASRRLLVNITFPRTELRSIAQEMVPYFRKGVKDLFTWSQRQEVPVLVISAGIGESVIAALEAADLLLPHVKVVSNFLKFDHQDRDRIIGFEGELICMYNKNQAVIKGTEYYDKVKNRSNVILIGNSMGDADMADGMDTCDTIIKVGFLGLHEVGSLYNYLHRYDIVLVNDDTVEIVNAILKLVP